MGLAAAASALAVAGCGEQPVVNTSAKPDTDSDPIPIRQTDTLPIEGEMRKYLDALEEGDSGLRLLITNKLKQPSTIEWSTKPKILKTALVYDKGFHLDEVSLEGFNLSKLGMRLEHHPELQQDGLGMSDTYNSLVLIQDPNKTREEWFDNGARDVIATYYSQLAAVHNAPFGPETTKSLKTLLDKDPSSPALALPMIERELALEAAISDDYSAVIKKLKIMADSGFEDQIAQTIKILDRPSDQRQDPVDFWSVEIFVNCPDPDEMIWRAGSLQVKNPIVPPQKGNKYPGAVSYTLFNRVHGVDSSGDLITRGGIGIALTIDSDEAGKVTLSRGMPIERPLDRVPFPKKKTNEDNSNKIG